MYLKRIEIQGFKSFAEPISIDFKDGLTCIVGPNGSGKSNISDAMRWVLGEQSARTLRGTKMEEIIFAGTETRRPKGMAEVTLIFDNSTGILPIDYAEVAIKRRLFRSGESEYFINGGQCRLRDIRELIMDTGIGVEGYSFVGQGQIDRIVNAKPEELREIFEEAAGVIKYKNRKAEAQRRLDSAQGNLDRMNDIILDIESRIDGLAEESAKAKEHAELSARHRELDINITLKNIETTTEKNKTLTKDAEEAGAEIARLRAEKERGDNDLTGKRRESDEKSERVQELTRQIAEAENRILTLESSAAIREEKQRGLARDRVRLTEETISLGEKIREEEALQQETIATAAGFDERLAALAAALAGKQEAEQGVAEKLTETGEALSQVQGEIFELTRQRSMKEQELSGNRDLMGSFDSTRIRMEEERRLEEAERSSVRHAINGAVAKQEGLKAEITMLEEKIAAARGEREETLSRVAATRERAEKTRSRIAEKGARKDAIEEMESNYEGYSQGIKDVMKQGIAGLEGVVAEIISVPKGLETAVETALGATLQNIVTKDEGSAKEAIEYLKKNKAGRLTFLPLDRIKTEERGKKELPADAKGFIGLAKELIGYDARYENVMDFLLGKVIIAETLDDAIGISMQARGGYKIVTREGEVIRPSGALTGGAFKHRSANLLERRGEIATLKAEIETLEEDATRLDAELAQLVAAAEALTEKEERHETDRRDRAAQLADVGGELKSLVFRSEDLEAKLKQKELDLSNIRTDKESGEKMNAALREQIREITEQITALEAQAGETEAQIAQLREQAGAAAEETTQLRVDLAAAETEKAGAAEGTARALARLGELKAELADKEAQLASVLASEAAVTDEAATAELLAQTQEERSGLTAQLETLSGARKALLAQIETAEAAYRELTARLESLVDSKTAMDVELGRQETRLANWKERLFEEYELSYVHALEFRKEDFVMSAAVRESREIKSRLLEIGEVNPGSIKEYDEVSERYEFLREQREDILSSLADYQKIVEDMDKISRARFRETFDGVVENFSGVFQKLFGGGKGSISLEEDKDPLESGILIKVQPPGKTSLMSMHLYSGGERTMIGIALMFSILEIKPAPFCILDEVDAALDETNIQRFAEYLKNFVDVQFALVTHQRSTMEYANTLFGVTMQEKGVTSILSLLLGEAETEAFAKTLDGKN
ncbi:MAG: chromosome segregation protein SMC [Clostridiales Family XIII bacterium]|jgi:chromosome segregation protein|nr:chromosome segregation protein SMC [Clostridiales Family XIII bacterium]